MFVRMELSSCFDRPSAAEVLAVGGLIAVLLASAPSTAEASCPAPDEVQARLTELEYLRPGDASGTFDLSTSEAVRRFQSDRGVHVTGEVGPETLIVLYRALRYGAPSLLAEATS